MKLNLFYKTLLLAIISLFALGSIDGGDKVKETALFKYDSKKKEIVSSSPEVKNYINLKFVSVTTDQPIYWPNEDVFLKVVFPTLPSKTVTIKVQKKDATPKEIGKFILNDGGLLVKNILSGKTSKIEPGEYRVDVSAPDDKIESYTTFSVVEGSLGAVSFAFDFEQITDPKKLENVNGGYFLGNAAGVGKRWGNGLNVKNEVRILNQPYTGKVTIKSRCYLPGCNGVEAGHSIEKDIVDGKLETVVDVGGHSGPFEIEVITPKGNVRNLFSKSGHVERQTTQISNNLVNVFNATLAPYSGTIPIYGRQIFIEQKLNVQKSPFELQSPVCDLNNETELIVKDEIVNGKIFLYNTNKDNKVKEISIAKKLKAGDKIKIKCSSPYNFLTVGGFVNNSKDFYEGWAILFTESPTDVNIETLAAAKPLQNIKIKVKTQDRASGKGKSNYCLLEVFDNRVPSKGALDPLISSIGDSYRSLSDYITSWVDNTGILSQDAEEISKPSAVAPSTGVGGVNLKVKEMNGKAGAAPMRSFAKRSPGPGLNLADGNKTEQVVIEEPIREGEKKVVFCDIIKTDANGIGEADVQLPPQTGRCKIRATVIDKYDYNEKIKEIDVSKNSYVEVNLQTILLPNSNIYAFASVVNSESAPVKLKIHGAGLSKEEIFEVAPGMKDIEFELSGGNYGKIYFDILGNDGTTKDKREFTITNVSSYNLTFSEVMISDGSEIKIDKDQKVAIYSNPAKMLRGIVMNMVTTMYSWFGHSEALTSATAVRAMLISAIDNKILDDEGLRSILKADLYKTMKDLDERFFDWEKGVMNPYPGITADFIWSIWAVRNLTQTVSALDKIKDLDNDLSFAKEKANQMIVRIKEQIINKALNTDEFLFSEKGDVIPIEIDGKVVYKLITDDAVVDWYVKKMVPILDLPNSSTLEDLNKKIIKKYDMYRFLRAFERTGNIYYLLLNSKALLLKDDPHFFELFNKIAKGMVATQDPGMIQGPALLGGVYSAPQTAVKFLDILIEMANKKMFTENPSVEFKTSKGKSNFVIKEPKLLENTEGTLKAPKYVSLRLDKKKEMNLYSFLENKQFFTTNISKKSMTIGEEVDLRISLDKSKDPTEYYALIVVPSNLAIRQSDDLLSDYKGQLIYGQRTGGGEKINLMTIPFRGSREMVLHCESVFKGSSEGFVFVRHINNPDDVSTIKIERVEVK